MSEAQIIKKCIAKAKAITKVKAQKVKLQKAKEKKRFADIRKKLSEDNKKIIKAQRARDKDIKSISGLSKNLSKKVKVKTVKKENFDLLDNYDPFANAPDESFKEHKVRHAELNRLIKLRGLSPEYVKAIESSNRRMMERTVNTVIAEEIRNKKSKKAIRKQFITMIDEELARR